MQIINVQIDKLLNYECNARTHSDQQLRELSESIKKFGFNDPIECDKNLVIISGHARLQAAKNVGLAEVPVIIHEHLEDADKRAYILAANKIAIKAGWDNELLKIEMNYLDELGFDLSLTGFDEKEIKDLLALEVEKGFCDEDECPDVLHETITKPGDIWILENHRVMCGDATVQTDVDKLISDYAIDTIYTDPPYGINESGDRSSRKGLADGSKYKDFRDDSVQYAIDAYNLCSSLNVTRQVWWGANYYCHALPLSNNWFVWDKRVEEKQKDNNSDCELAWVKSKWSSIRIFRHLWKGMIKGSENGQHRVHPTQKPVALAEWSLDYFKESKVVLDLFGGSGSTLIACEKTNRDNCTMEIDPHYCDVIIKRWQKFTNKKAILESTGEQFNG